MEINIRVSTTEAQFIYVRSDDEVGYVIQIADLEIHELPRFALEDLHRRIGETLGLDKTER